MIPFITINDAIDIELVQKLCREYPIEIGGFIFLPECSIEIEGFEKFITGAGRNEPVFTLDGIALSLDTQTLAFEMDNPHNISMLIGQEISSVLKAYGRGIPYLLFGSDENKEGKASAILEIAIAQGWTQSDSKYQLRFVVDVDNKDEVLRLASIGITAFALKPQLAMNLF